MRDRRTGHTLVEHSTQPHTARLARLSRAVPAAAAAAVLAAGGIAAANASTGTAADHNKTLSVNIHDQALSFVDNPPAGDSLGDIAVFDGAVRRNGHPYGHLDAYGVMTRTAPHGADVLELTGSVRVPHGEISVQGAILTDARRYDIPITGGSGAYRNVRGYISVRNTPGGSRNTLHLIGAADSRNARRSG